MAKRKQIVVDLDENMTVHAKAYFQTSLDKAIKAFQAMSIQQSGENVTYSEAMRRLIVAGLLATFEVFTDSIEIQVQKGDKTL